IQTAKKLLPRILRSNLPWAVKREAFFHLTNNGAYLLMILLSVLMPISMVVRFHHGLYQTLFLDLPFAITATLSVCFFYVATQRELGLSWWRRLKYLPFLMSLGIGLAVNNAKAVFEALINYQSGFTRTPKTGVEGRSARAPIKRAYRGSKTWLPIIELAFGLYFTGALWYAIDAGIFTSVPFLVLFQVGFLYVGMASLIQGRVRTAPAQAQSTAQVTSVSA
ncbi:MAG TPA: glycosyl transferase family 2, partial [Myxococcaceae bacterium]